MGEEMKASQIGWHFLGVLAGIALLSVFVVAWKFKHEANHR